MRRRPVAGGVLSPGRRWGPAAAGFAAMVMLGAAAPAGGVPAGGVPVAILQGLDKTTARVSRFDAPVDQSVRFGTLIITVRACVKRPPEEPPETAAFLEIDEVKPGEPNAAPERVFSGWMFASSPALSALEDPIYDVGVLDCKAPTISPGNSAAK